MIWEDNLISFMVGFTVKVWHIAENLLMLPLYPPLFQFQSVRSPFIVPITSQSPASLQLYTLFFIRKTNLTIVKHMINWLIYFYSEFRTPTHSLRFKLIVNKVCSPSPAVQYNCTSGEFKSCKWSEMTPMVWHHWCHLTLSLSHCYTTTAAQLDSSKPATDKDKAISKLKKKKLSSECKYWW